MKERTQERTTPNNIPPPMAGDNKQYFCLFISLLNICLFPKALFTSYFSLEYYLFMNRKLTQSSSSIHNQNQPHLLQSKLSWGLRHFCISVHPLSYHGWIATADVHGKDSHVTDKHVTTSRTLGKQGFMHMSKVSSKISLCSLHGLIMDNTFRLNWIFAKKTAFIEKYHKSVKCCPRSACSVLFMQIH